MSTAGRLRRLVVVLFPALLGPSQVLFFGPLTVFSTNAAEFVVSFWTLAAQWVWFLVPVVGALVLIGVVLPERPFERYVATLFGLGVLLWIQGNLLVADYGLLYGEGLDLDRHAWRAPYEIGLWIGVLGLVAVFATNVSKVAPLASQLLVALQAVAMIALTFSADYPAKPVGWQTPPEEIYQLSRGQNVILIVLDGFQSEYFGEILEEERATFDRDFSGFVFFADHLGAFPTTRASMPAMFTGVAYRNDMPFDRFFESVRERSILDIVSQRGYQIHSVGFLVFDRPYLTTPGPNTIQYTIPTPYESYRDYVDFSAAQVIDLSLFRHVPHGFKSRVYNDQAWLAQRWYVERRPPELAARDSRPSSHSAFLAEFARRSTLGGDEPLYTFFHLANPHPPIVVDADCSFRGVTETDPASYTAQARCALRGVQQLLSRLRVLGLYDSSVIVLTSDHGWDVRREGHPLGGIPSPAGNLDAVAVNAMPLLAIKPPDGTGPVETSYAPTAITDIPATIFDLLGLPNYFGQGQSAFQLDPDVPRPRRYTHHTWNNAAWSRP